MNEIYSPILSWVKMEDKEIKRRYHKRRKTLKKGNCVRCGFSLKLGGIMSNYKCPNCKTDILDFCFKDLEEEAKSKAKNITEKAKTKARDVITKAKHKAKK